MLGLVAPNNYRKGYVMSKDDDTKTDVGSPNIYQRLQSVMRDVGFMEREQTKNLKYPTISHSTVTAKLQPALLAHGVFLEPTTLSCETQQVERQTYKGITKTYRTDVEVVLRWINIDKPDEWVQGVWWGSGLGDDGKTPAAAYSFAIKSGVLKTLCIPTGDDEEQYNAKQPQTPQDAPESTNDPSARVSQAENDVGEHREPRTDNEYPESMMYTVAKKAIGEMCQRHNVEPGAGTAWIQGQYKGKSLEDMKDDEALVLEVMTRMTDEFIPAYILERKRINEENGK